MVEEKKTKKTTVLMATLATAQTELSWAGTGLRLTKFFFYEENSDCQILYFKFHEAVLRSS